MDDQRMEWRSFDAEPLVLVVEDEAVTRRALARVLRESGYAASAVASAEEALRLLEARGPKPLAAALIDVDLPGMDGLSLVEQIEKRWPGTVPILVTAADADRISRFLARHRAYYVPKPLNVQRVLSILQTSH
jgi:CheY-like chemotaxis protein